LNPAGVSLRYRVVTLSFVVLLVVGGIVSYQKMARLEDPEFTIKDAQVITLYPGATALEVSEEVTDELETAIQQMGQLDYLTSISQPGKSTIQVTMKNKYDRSSLPQIWDELRRKVGDAQRNLPPGAGPSIVYDDFGDVYGVLFAVYGDGFTYAELKDYVDILRRELLLVQDVAKITVTGAQQEVVYVEISRAKLAQLGLPPETVYRSLAGQNLVVQAGSVQVGREYIRIQPTGELSSVADIGDVLILQPGGSRLYLKDIATIRRGYVDPPGTIVRFNGRPAIAVGISTVEGGNAVTMGNAVTARLHELAAETPIGIEFGVISLQSEAVTTAVNGFMVSLAEALAIVIAVLMIAMGLRSGVIIGVILLLTVLATFIAMKAQGVLLERISLGALIIALGMLVDNAIVVVEGILVSAQKGVDKAEAAQGIVKQTMWPLFGATVIAVLTFAAIGASQDSTGEYCRSLYQVVLYSLMASWVLAITVTPLFGVMFLRAGKPQEGEAADPYAGGFYRIYRGLLGLCMRLRWVTIAVLVVLLLLAFKGFGSVGKSFFPDSTRPQFLVHFWMPQGTHITETEAALVRAQRHVMGLEGVTDVAAFVGKGSPRFLLTYSPEDANTAYGLLLVGIEDYKEVDRILGEAQDYIDEEFQDVQAFGRRFVLGPGDPNKIQVRLRGPDVDVLRVMGDQVRGLMLAEPSATDILNDWRERVPMIQPVVAEAQARNAGVTRADIADAMQMAMTGRQVGLYREKDDLLPITVVSPPHERDSVDDLYFAQVYSPVAGSSIPIQQVVTSFEARSENTIIRRRNRMPTLTMKCDPIPGMEATEALANLMPQVEAWFAGFVRENNLLGYSLEWGGEYEDSGKAQTALASKIPLIVVLIVVVLICLFNSIRQPLIICLTVPLSLIGVTAGLLIMRQPFGFMALLGFMSLAGMLMKNAIVLMDEINVQVREGRPRWDALLDAGTSRLRPVSMAAATTVLGMIPLLADAFFVAMAVTIMFGLTFATVLTLVVVPVLYTIFYRVSPSETTERAEPQG
jgi:multidrug efflux pump subunit AcrB